MLELLELFEPLPLPLVELAWDVAELDLEPFSLEELFEASELDEHFELFELFELLLLELAWDVAELDLEPFSLEELFEASELDEHFELFELFELLLLELAWDVAELDLELFSLEELLELLELLEHFELLLLLLDPLLLLLDPLLLLLLLLLLLPRRLSSRWTASMSPKISSRPSVSAAKMRSPPLSASTVPAARRRPKIAMASFLFPTSMVANLWFVEKKRWVGN